MLNEARLQGDLLAAPRERHSGRFDGKPASELIKSLATWRGNLVASPPRIVCTY